MVFCPISQSEDQLQRKLKLPRTQGQIRSRDLAKPARPEDRRGARSTSTNAGKSRAPLRDGNIGLPKVLGVGDIVNLRPELQLHPLTKLEVLEQREIRAPVVRAVQLGTRFVPDSTYRLRGKCIDIDPVVVVLVGRRIRDPGNHVGTIHRHKVAHVRWNRSHAIQNGEGYTRLIEGEQVGLPSADGELLHSAPGFSERKLIVQTEGKSGSRMQQLAIGGWQANLLAFYQSGVPFTV